MKTLLFALAAIAVVATPVSAQYGGFGGGTVGSSGTPTQMDSCPNGDYSASFYDGTCGTAPSGSTLELGSTGTSTTNTGTAAGSSSTDSSSTTNTGTTSSTTTNDETTDSNTTTTDPVKDGLTLGQFDTDTENAVGGSMNLPGMLPKTGSEVSYVIFALFAMMSVFGLRLIK